MPLILVRNDITRMAVAETVCQARMGMPIRADWKNSINEDFQNRV